MRALLASLGAAALLASGGVAFAQGLSLGSGEDLASGTLVGRVCEDQNADGRCTDDEPGIGGARVLLENGLFALTDADGRWHLNAVPERQILTVQAPSGATLAETFGRHVVKLDLRSVGPRATVASERQVVELGPAALVQVDFAVQRAAVSESRLAPSASQPSRGELKAGAIEFLATGTTAAGHVVEVNGVRAEVVAGTFSTRVPLHGGMNVLAVSDLAPDGTLTFFTQQVEVAERPRAGTLFVPGPFLELARFELPPVDSAPAGDTSVVVRGAPGTKLRLEGQETVLGLDGRARLPLQLKSGDNAVHVSADAPTGEHVASTLALQAAPHVFAAALVDLQLSLSPSTRELFLQGTGAATFERRFGDALLTAGANLDGSDFAALRTDRLVLFEPRRPLAIERALDPDLYPPETADDGLAGALNPASGRLFANLVHPELGRAQLGAFQADLGGAQVGQFRRSLFGLGVDAKVPLGPVALRAQAVGAPELPQGSAGQTVPAHDELLGTGGSLLYLRHAGIVPGSEKLRVEVRDGLTGLTVETRVLHRYADYEIDYRAGRVLLTKPLPMSEGLGPLASSSLVVGKRPVLTADYEHEALGAPAERVLAGKLGIDAPVAGVSAGLIDDRRFSSAATNDYRLVNAQAHGGAGPFQLTAEVAQSTGTLYDPTLSGGIGLSETGGLSFLEGTAPDRVARAASVRASLETAQAGGQLWFLTRQAGFNDSATMATTDAHQVGGQARVQINRVTLSAAANDRVAVDPRAPFGDATVGGRDAVLRARIPIDRLTLTPELTAETLSAAPSLGEAALDGGRAGAGLRADYELTSAVSVNASHHQSLVAFGEGFGARSDTFSAVGATVRLHDDLGFAVRGGWGPVLGTQVQASAERTRDDEVAYGGTTVDVDGPDAGRLAAFSGARRRVANEADVYAEDVVARDLNGMRAGRAVGIDVAPLRAVAVSGRYERGVLAPFTGASALLRDTGSARASWMLSNLRLSALGEVRRDAGLTLSGADAARVQLLGGVAAEARPLKSLGLFGRVNASRTVAGSAVEAKFIEGNLGAALRLAPFVLLLRYGLTHELPPPVQGVRAEQTLHLLSLQPAVDIGTRFRLGGGIFAGLFRSAAARSDTVAASLRPSVRVVDHLEIAAEVARRTSGPAGESLNALRAEVGYRFEALMAVAVGYNLLGFSGTGVEPASARSDRIYVRLEAAY